MVVVLLSGSIAFADAFIPAVNIFKKTQVVQQTKSSLVEFKKQDVVQLHSFGTPGKTYVNFAISEQPFFPNIKQIGLEIDALGIANSLSSRYLMPEAYIMDDFNHDALIFTTLSTVEASPLFDATILKKLRPESVVKMKFSYEIVEVSSAGLLSEKVSCSILLKPVVRLQIVEPQGLENVIIHANRAHSVRQGEATMGASGDDQADAANCLKSIK